MAQARNLRAITITVSTKEVIRVGCKAFSLEQWSEHYKTIAKAEGYTPKQIEEYGKYLDLIKSLSK